jgi:hypothetical protein
MKPTNTTPAALTANQLRIVQLFAAMDDRRQEEMLHFAAGVARTFPRRAAPQLRLVGGGAK